MEKIEAYKKMMGLKNVLPAASAEIDEICEALTNNENVIKGIKAVLSILGANPSDEINVAYNILTKIVIDCGDYHTGVRHLLWMYATNVNRRVKIKLNNPVKCKDGLIDEVYIDDEDEDKNVRFHIMRNKIEINGLTFKIMERSTQLEVFNELKKTIGKNVFENKLVTEIVSRNESDGVGFEVFLEVPISIKHNGEELEINRLIVGHENGKLLCQAMNENDGVRFIYFDSIPFEIQETLYNEII